MVVVGTMLVAAGALRLAASVAFSHRPGRRTAWLYVIAGVVVHRCHSGVSLAGGGVTGARCLGAGTSPDRPSLREADIERSVRTGLDAPRTELFRRNEHLDLGAQPGRVPAPAGEEARP